jgi:hypothetical protein
VEVSLILITNFRNKYHRNLHQYSNADKEVDIIDAYFIKPDYFEDVWGNPYNPVSNIVYAPRGGGNNLPLSKHHSF